MGEPSDIRVSPQTLSVLEALLEEPAAWRYGYDLSRETGLKSGTLYPVLMRLAVGRRDARGTALRRGLLGEPQLGGGRHMFAAETFADFILRGIGRRVSGPRAIGGFR